MLVSVFAFTLLLCSIMCILMLYYSILLHCVDLTLRFVFRLSMGNVGSYSLIVFPLLTLHFSA
jgi:hypothetical protein